MYQQYVSYTFQVDLQRLKVSAPTLITPINDDTSADTTPTLIATESSGKYAKGSLAYDFELLPFNEGVYREDVPKG